MRDQDENMNGECAESKSTLVSRNITVFGKRTSVRLEPEMWDSLKEIADREMCTIHDICTLIGIRKKKNTSLTAAIRVFIMLYFRASSTEDGHRKAGHGNFEIMMRRARIPEDNQSFFTKRISGRLSSVSQSNSFAMAEKTVVANAANL